MQEAHARPCRTSHSSRDVTRDLLHFFPGEGKGRGGGGVVERGFPASPTVREVRPVELAVRFNLRHALPRHASFRPTGHSLGSQNGWKQTGSLSDLPVCSSGPSLAFTHMIQSNRFQHSLAHEMGWRLPLPASLGGEQGLDQVAALGLPPSPAGSAAPLTVWNGVWDSPAPSQRLIGKHSIQLCNASPCSKPSSPVFVWPIIPCYDP